MYTLGKQARALFFLYALAFAIISTAPFFVSAETMEERRLRLESELAVIEQDIVEKRGVLSEKQAERTSLERDMAILDNQIAIAAQEIRFRDITLSKIRDGITDKRVAISELDKKVERSEASLAQLIRRTREIDDLSLSHFVLAGSLSEVFRDLDDFHTLQKALDVSFQEMALLRSDLLARRTALESQESDEERLRRLQLLEKKEIERKEREKQQILTATKGEEKAYQELIAERERTAAQIRAVIFELLGSADISFGTAYEFAKSASVTTGVRPAFLLGILKNESDLGKNVGQCLLTNEPERGNGKGVNTGRLFERVMHPNRDVDSFIQITTELGINWNTQVVSCPQSVGYGGAMGPAQFIPSTWMLYKDRIARATGKNPPNPWLPQTAFTASAIFLADLGADRGTSAAEREAALRYFAGGNWKNPAFASYGTRVLNFAEDFQKQIDILEGR